MPEVSVIIPNFNHAPFLELRINSVLNQTFQDYEVIILDDCSTDNSRDVIEQYRDHSKVSQVVFNEQNSGTTFKQWEKGIGLATGKYIWIAESDDYCEPEFLSTAIRSFKQNDDVALFFSRSYQVDQKNEVLNDFLWWTKDLPAYNWEKDFTESGDRIITSCLSKKNVIVNASAVVFKKENSLKALAGITGLRKCGDWLFWTLLITGKQVAYHGTPLNYFRDHQQSTRSFGNMESKLVRCLEEYYVKKQIQELTGNVQTKIQADAAFNNIFRTAPASDYEVLKKVYSKVLHKDLSKPAFLYYKFRNKLIKR
jgi:glycosyltransferase involved in cell wall biosynthesis